MKYLHIFHNDKVVAPYIRFINENFNKNEHKFLVIDGIKEKDIEISFDENVKKYISRGREYKGIIKKLLLILQLPILYFNLFLSCSKAKKIYFHGLFDIRIVFFLYIFKDFLKKSFWDMWGGDLYSFSKNKKIIYKKIDDYVKGNFYGYITYIDGDYELVKKWYKAKGKYFKCFIYPSNLYKEMEILPSKREDLYVQIGNSADPSNNHFEILNKLERFKNKNIKLFCILSYGDKIYAEKIIKYGEKIFKEKFIPIVDFMLFEDYMKFLSEIDIAIFAHKRQQGMGNITSLLGMKKTLYMDKNVTTFVTLKKMGVSIKSLDDIEDLSKFNNFILEKNERIIKQVFSKETLLKDTKNYLYESEEEE